MKNGLLKTSHRPYFYADGRIQVNATVLKVLKNGTKRFVLKRPYQERWFKDRKAYGQAIIDSKLFA